MGFRFKVSFRSSFEFSLGFHSRVSYQDLFSRFLNVQVGSFRVPLGFHVGRHLGFFRVSLGFQFGFHLGVHLGFQFRVAFRVSFRVSLGCQFRVSAKVSVKVSFSVFSECCLGFVGGVIWGVI